MEPLGAALLFSEPRTLTVPTTGVQERLDYFAAADGIANITAAPHDLIPDRKMSRS
ncbi:hypothetical protein GCM10022403_034250 [Streptomyces coacervatus]|uniref:Uncharacterized protein n=1 Tax=Streptomyces coacervatus TaxID=647381 RepID=A0ABP7HR10_9ACTN